MNRLVITSCDTAKIEKKNHVLPELQAICVQVYDSSTSQLSKIWQVMPKQLLKRVVHGAPTVIQVLNEHSTVKLC